MDWGLLGFILGVFLTPIGFLTDRRYWSTFCLDFGAILIGFNVVHVYGLIF